MRKFRWHKPNTTRNYFQCKLEVCNLIMFTFTVMGWGLSINIPIRKEAKRFRSK